MFAVSRWWLSYLVIGVAFVLCLSSWGGVGLRTAAAETAREGEAPAESALIAQVNAEFNLLRSQVAALELDTTPGVSQSVTVSLGGESFDLHVSRHSARSPEHYEVKYQQPDGSFIVVEPGPVLTVRGTVGGVQGAVVAGALNDEGLTAMIQMADGQRWWVEPLVSRLPEARAGEHVIYREEDAIGTGGTCATVVDGMLHQLDGDPLPAGGGCNGIPCVAEMGVDADVEFFARWGGNTEARINLITNIMNIQYENDVGITHELTTILVRSQEPDPYSATEPVALLGQFQAHWFNDQQEVVRDLAQLFTGKNLDGSVIGIAFVGRVCSLGVGYGVVQSLSNTSCATDLSAHEMGHIWGALHCSCPGSTMNPSLTCTNNFSQFSVNQIVSHRNSRSCLSDSAPATAFPFEDTFADTQIDPVKWAASGATVSSLGINPPSPPFSMRIPGDARPLTGFMDTTASERVVVEYWWQRTGLVASPEAGDDLILEYHGQGALWTEVERQLGDPGGGGDAEPFERSCVLLPEDASFNGLQLRLSIDGGDLSDNFFVDDFRVADASTYLRVVRQPEPFGCGCLDGSARFSVEADGIAPFSYQWWRNGVPLPSATDATLLISPLSTEDFGVYSVDVSNECGTIRSEEGQLVQDTFPAVVTTPQSGSVQVGQTLFLNVVAGGGGCNAFQWLFNGAPIPGANGSFLLVQNMQCHNQGCYSVEVSTDCGSVTSDIAEIIVNGDCGPVSCVDTAAPVILHGEGLAGQTRPFSGYIDPRRESDNGVDLNQGITEVSILFSEPVQAVGGG
ncbi:MAG: M12 family metallo-peptidase, partial [Phycisphaerae bacterium]